MKPKTWTRRPKKLCSGLRFLPASAAVLRVWQLMGADRMLPIYATLESATSAT
jgi:hypothetical protein